MADSRPDPDWDLLPEDPLGFFGLSPGYDRTELRRAYTRLIRRFKPERNPEEFQRIREAYEALDAYPGFVVFEPAADFPIEAEPDESEPDWNWADDSEGTFIRRPFAAELGQRLAESSPEELHRELARKGDKDPLDHYALAVLTDAVEPEGAAGFGSRLVDGLAQHPDAGELRELLRHYFWEPLDAAEGAAALRAARALEPEEFLALTEPLWIRLGASMPFSAWRSLMQKAATALARAPIDCRARFDLRLTRAMMFRADDDWWEERMSWLEEHEADIPSVHHDTLDRLEMLGAYRRVRDAWLAGHPFRRRVDRVLRAWVEEDTDEVQRLFGDLQQEILVDPQQALAAFPPEVSETHPVMPLYLTLAAELAPQLGVDSESLFEDEIEPDEVEEPVRFLDELDKRTARSSIARHWNRRLVLNVFGSGLGCVIVAGLVLVVAVQTARVMAVSAEFGTGVMIAVICTVVILSWAIHKAASRSRRRLSAATRGRIHAELWRDEVVRFQFEACLTHWQLIHATCCGDKSRWSYVIYLRAALEKDPGLVLFGIALKFQG